MMGLDYVMRKALEYRRPVAINLSFGNTYGSHDGTSLLSGLLMIFPVCGKIVFVLEPK